MKHFKFKTLAKIDGITEISKEDWTRAMTDYSALRELLEARFNQDVFVEALAIACESDDHIFIAVSDMREHYTDFSAFESMLEKRKSNVYKTRYFSTSSESALLELVQTISKAEFADSISI
jgi:hypothetical protein